MMTGEKPLQKEYSYYTRVKADLLKQYSCKFALIKDEKVVGTFDTDADAYKAGLLQFGNTPFLIILVSEKDEATRIPLLELGLIDAGN